MYHITTRQEGDEGDGIKLEPQVPTSGSQYYENVYRIRTRQQISISQ